ALAAGMGRAETVSVPAECAGMSAFRKFWDRPVVVAANGLRKVEDDTVTTWGLTAVWDVGSAGPLAFDAVHRSLLVRFPDAAEAIAAKLKEGFAIEKVEIVLSHRDEELWTDGRPDIDGGYFWKKNWNVDTKFYSSRPNWHAVAYALRKPWKADKERGPTFNAAVNGAIYWKRWGAMDTQEDRFDHEFGPTEVSSYNPEGRMDVTALLTEEAFGGSLGERLRQFADCGLVVRKWEVYDHRYFDSGNGAYEHTTSGSRAIVVKEPTLVVTFGEAERLKGEKAERVEGEVQEGDVSLSAFQPFSLPPAADIAAMAAMPAVGEPTAVVLSPEEVRTLDEKFLARPAWMPEWQYARVRELATLEKGGDVEPFYYQLMGGTHYAQAVTDKMRKANPSVSQEEIDYAVYLMWVDYTLCRSPRMWEGHLTAANAITLWYDYREAMPGPAMDHFKQNWTAWLMPERKSVPTWPEWSDFENISGDIIFVQADATPHGLSADKQRRPTWGHYYYDQTGDWRGNRSFYRGAFTRGMSTQNFNYHAVSGALLLGQVIGSERALEDGRYGLLHLPFWLWTYGVGGVSQEYIDHYYWAITIAGSKLYPDYSERLEDKMLGWSILEKTIEDLAGGYHANLRKLIGPASRSADKWVVLGGQDGLQHILHVLSPKGALTDRGGTLPAFTTAEGKAVKTFGTDYPARTVATQSMSAPWTDAWMTELVDEKPIPWSLRAQKGGSWVTTYFGENYGLASIVNNLGIKAATTSQRYHVLGHWRRKAEQPESMTEIGSLDMRVGFNDQTRFADDRSGGWTSRYATYKTHQYKNKVIMLAKPNMNEIMEGAKGYADGGNTYPSQDVTSVQCSAALFNFEEGGPTWDIYVDGQKVEALPVTAKYGQVVTVKDGVSYVALRPLGREGTQNPERSTQHGEVTLARGELETTAAYRSLYRAELIVNAYMFTSDTAISEEEIEKLRNAYGGFVIEMGDENEYGSFEAFQKAMMAAPCEVERVEGGIKVRYGALA
ncbi:MAG: hypothetical protein FWF84_07260, partial [Kiritimatiellaeota bacterium]|nr:hypothetical protein [Kiritimatiellota bacterium]